MARFALNFCVAAGNIRLSEGFGKPPKKAGVLPHTLLYLVN